MGAPGPPSVPLLVHSCGSLLWGTASPEDLIRQAKDDGRPGLALTDRDNLYLAVEALEAAEAHGVKLLLGAEVTQPGSVQCPLEDRSSEQSPSGTTPLARPLSAIVYALDLDGYGRLCHLISLRQLEDDFDLVSAMETVGADASNAGIFIACEDPSLLSKLAERVPPRRLGALVIRKAGRPVEWERSLRDIAHNHSLAVLASAQTTLLTPEDESLHTLLVACRKGCLVSQVEELERVGPWAVWSSAEETAAVWRDDPASLVRGRDLLERATLHFRDLAERGPIFPRVESDPEASYHELYRMCQEGLARRYQRVTSRVVRRLHQELEVIRELGFLDYFLVVGGIVQEARRRGIPTVGRGSGAGSIISYLLGITNVDPVRHNLYFERFLHRLRKDLPDLDIDFCWRRRDEIIQWSYEQYGRDRVAMISTHNVFHPRSAFRETAKAFGIPHALVNRLCRAIPHRYDGDEEEHPRGSAEEPRPQPRPSAEDPPVMEAVRRSPLAHRVPLDEEPYPQVFRMAQRLLGLPRHLGIHPGGIVISDGPLNRYVPLEWATKGIVVTQFEMRAVEKVGLVKIDLLGNRALSTIAETLEILGAEGTELPWDEIPEDDEDTATLLRRGETLGCFQIESPGMRQLLTMTLTENFPGTLHTVALIRPGPASSGMKDAFIRRMRGEEAVSVRHPRLISLLAPTYGVMLYEEDVMCVASLIGGFSLELGDLLRRAIGAAKSIEAESDGRGNSDDDPWHGRSLDELEDVFVQRAVKSGIGVRVAREVWEDLCRFGAYAFCKAHAAGYAVLSYRTAYLKAHHVGPFAAALMNNHQGMYPLWVHVEEMRRRGLDILHPCVHRGDMEWTWEGEGLRCGMGQVAGVSERTLDAILHQRRDGPFTSLGDLLDRTRAALTEVEALVRGGALRDVPPGEPTQHLWNLYCLGGRSRPRPDGSGSLALESRGAQPVLREVAPPSLRERVHEEMEVLGVAVSAHPVAAWRSEQAGEGKGDGTRHGKGDGRVDGRRDGKADRRDGKGVEGTSRDLAKGGRRSLVGRVAASRRVRTTRGGMMLFVTLDDELGTAECVAWPEVYADAVRALATSRLVEVAGVVKERHGAATLELESIRPIVPA